MLKSPFPGLDPYLEKDWPGVHRSWIVYAADALQSTLPDDLMTQIVKRKYLCADVHSLSAAPSDPCVLIASAQGHVVENAETERVETQSFYFGVAEERETYLQILEIKGEKVVTMIELPNPANKIEGPGRAAYARQRRRVLRTDANLVEIDLVRTGRRNLALPMHHIPDEWRNDALVCVRNGRRRNRVDLIRLPLRQRLPVVPIPLRDGDPPALLDLQAVHDRCYRSGRYDRLINYTVPPTPPLADAEWANELLASAGKIGKPAS